MSEARDKMDAALKEHVVPALRSRGFSGSFPHFRRIRASVVDMLTFCFSQAGGNFCVEVASCPLERLIGHLGTPIPVSKAKVWNAPSRRLRLGSRDMRLDHWFRFDETCFAHIRTTTFYRRDGDPYERAAKAVLNLLEHEPFPIRAALAA